MSFKHLYVFYDDDDGDRSCRLAKIRNFAEDTVLKFNDHQFKRHFRMYPTTFEDLLQKLYSCEEHDNLLGHPEMSLDKQLMLTLWSLANLESFR